MYSFNNIGSEYENSLARKSFVKGIGNKIGITLIVFTIASLVFGSVLGVVLTIGGALMGNELMLVTDNNIIIAASSVISVILMTIPFIILTKSSNISLSSAVSLKKVSYGLLFALVAIAFGFNAIGNIATNLFASAMGAVGITPVAPPFDLSNDLMGFLLSIVCIGVFPALVEEFAFRGVILSILKKRFSPTSSIIISAVVFGLVHGNLVQIPFALLMGLAFGYITVYSGSLWPAIIAHFLNNTMSCVMDYATRGATPLTTMIISSVYMIVSIALLIIGVILLLKRDNHALKLPQSGTDFTIGTKTTVKWFLQSPAMIVFAVMTVLQIIITQASY
ncbi:MAG: type II CAAX endopeptidase family protein [Oscillospiraceae bacterium]